MKRDREILYVSYLDNWGAGIETKIKNHCDYFVNKGFDVTYITLARQITRIKKYLYKIIPFCSEYSYDEFEKGNDIVYIRYCKMDFQGYKALRKLRMHCNKIIIEIPTFPYDGEIKGIFKLFNYKDKIWRGKICKYVDKILTYSDDKEIYGIPTVNISNFVNIDTVSVSKRNNSELKKINLIAVASIAFWHGYDRIIEGMNIYYKHKNNPEYTIIFHMVGEGNELLKYKELVKKYNLGKYVKFYGRKTGNELDKIYDIADIAVDSLGRHRNHIYYNSTLKGKEYLAKGLPIISGVKTELDADDTFKYYLSVPADDTPIDMMEIVEFYNKIYSKEKFEIVHANIRKYAEDNFCIEKCMEPIMKIMEN